jgi:hypothetical protein
MFETEGERAAIEKVVRSLPPDPNKRTWSRRENFDERKVVVEKTFEGAFKGQPDIFPIMGRGGSLSSPSTSLPSILRGVDHEHRSRGGVSFSPVTSSQNYVLGKQGELSEDGDGAMGGAVLSGDQLAQSLAEMTRKMRTLSLVVDDLRHDLSEERRARAVAEAKHEERYEAIFELLGGNVLRPTAPGARRRSLPIPFDKESGLDI